MLITTLTVRDSLMKKPILAIPLLGLACAHFEVWASDGPAPSSSSDLFTSFTANPHDHPYLPDASYAGYRRGEVPLPIVPVVVNAVTAAGAVADGVTDNSGTSDTQVAVTSSNTTVVPNADIVAGGSGASRTVRVTPAAGQTGTVRLLDPVGSSSADFLRVRIRLLP